MLIASSCEASSLVEMLMITYHDPFLQSSEMRNSILHQNLKKISYLAIIAQLPLKNLEGSTHYVKSTIFVQ